MPGVPVKLVKRGHEVWLRWDNYFIRHPVSGEERLKHDCDEDISVEDVLTMYRGKLGAIRTALGMPPRDSSYSWDIESRARDVVNAEQRLRDIHSSYVVTSALGAVLVAADYLEEYLAELREEDADSHVDIRKLSGYCSRAGESLWES